MTKKVTKAVLPIAGLGTRFLPATKSMPKEMMTLVDRPLIQYAMDEARDAGITDFIFVTARGKSSLVDYFDKSPELEESLKRKGKDDLLEELSRTDMPSGAISTIRQQKALGLGHAVWCARRLIDSDESFAVILPDDVIKSDVPCLKQMVDAQAETGGCMVAAMEVEHEQTSKYGILDVNDDGGRTLRVKGMVEKPDPSEAPSNLAVIGRYILTPQVLSVLDNQDTGKGGEIQLTDAIAKQIDSEKGVHGLKFDGQRFDCGSKAGFLQATVAFGLSRPDLRDDLASFIKSLGPNELG
ncbi:UTP--glucose-1-phosphate uridylyltransferase [Palleronia marisminoris]|uniref:UTP--glucose-1-phosphate uridylyltransferase n=1 Tax=Palleronia marisminoris TaxID=315423 RepID=A0A1Y5SYG7_9RHOB|nr:UTP--glucose-1-phosphate uridylyltransferase GalU [Palleronia marisminoris]SFH07614.1 UTP--glucose-1-phosphate uridylyltransferase [Palleronia marisminoris]SLN51897.1 UTP--glucose-1-phosphate uridylyltransferase [Palleronia marisminoris]